MSNTFLCYKQDIPLDGCKGFSLTKPGQTSEADASESEQQEIFIVNRDNQFYAYKNSCPHTGASLNWQPDQFMDFDNFYIQCAIHAARFEVESGLCVWGPCVNRSLKKVNLVFADDKIYLAS